MNILQNIKQKFTTISSESALGLFLQSKTKKGYTWNDKAGMYFYKNLGVLYSAIEKRAEKVGETNLYLQKGEEIIREHDILNNLAKPNPKYTWEQFIALWQKSYDLYGEAYVLVLKDREFLSDNNKFTLEILEFPKVNPIFDTFGNLLRVEYNGNKITYQAEDIIYDFRSDPEKPYRGMSLLRAFSQMFGLAVDLEKLNANIIKNGGKLDGVVSLNQVLTKEQLDIIRKGFADQLDTKSDYGDMVFMGMDAKFQETSKSPNELGYKETYNQVIEMVSIATGVPKSLLGSFDGIKFDNADASIQIFLKETITPQIRQRITKLNEMFSVIPEELELRFDSLVPEDVDMKLKINDSAYKGKYLTINEMRENVGYDEIEGGDELPKTQSPFSMLDEDKDDEDKDDEDKEDEEDEEKEEKSIKKKDFHPLKDYSFRRKYWEQKIAKEDKFENEFKKELVKYLRGQEDRVLEYLSGKRRSKNLMDNAFNLKAEISLGKKVLMPLIMKYMMEAGEDATNLVGYERSFVWTSTLESSLNKRADFFLKSINETTFNKLKAEFKESTETGETRQELIKRISNTYGDITEGRAKTIARTEVHNGVQEATLGGYKQAGMSIKIWTAVMDDRTRDEHAEMDGEEKPIDMPFSNGLQYPSEINCRCVV
jgi:HK97 family phage portal protein